MIVMKNPRRTIEGTGQRKNLGSYIDAADSGLSIHGLRINPGQSTILSFMSWQLARRTLTINLRMNQNEKVF